MNIETLHDISACPYRWNDDPLNHTELRQHILDLQKRVRYLDKGNHQHLMRKLHVSGDSGCYFYQGVIAATCDLNACGYRNGFAIGTTSDLLLTGFMLNVFKNMGPIVMERCLDEIDLIEEAEKNIHQRNSKRLKKSILEKKDWDKLKQINVNIMKLYLDGRTDWDEL